MVKSILIIEDEIELQKYLKELLLDNGYSVRGANDGISALKAMEQIPPDLVLLDLGLPNMSGEAVCQELRKKFPQIPIIILTAKDAVTDIVKGLDIGADDYVTKPFNAEELLARIKARFRDRGENNSIIKIADLEVNNQTLEVKRKGKLIHLTPQEFKLLEYLLINKGRILTREMILNRVWLYSPDVETRVVDVYIGYLRKKIDSESSKKLLHSVRGFGYMIKE